MEAKELINNLMIGDWFRGPDPTPIRITRIDSRGMLVENQDTDEVGLEDLQPIPLTEDILKSNGFEYFDSGKGDDWKGYVKRSDKGGLYSVRILANLNEGFRCMILVEGKTDNRDEIYVTVYYVHQLQHLLRVCGLSDMADKLKIE